MITMQARGPLGTGSIEHLLRADGRYQFNRNWLVLLATPSGLQHIRETSIGTDSNGKPINGDERDGISHFGYVGVDCIFTAKFALPPCRCSVLRLQRFGRVALNPSTLP
jgi:hypothetical protein